MHNLDMTNEQANIAFLGSRNSVWHRLGQEMQPDQSLEVWAKQAGLAHSVVKVPAYAHLEGEQFANQDDHICRVEGKSFLVRSDNGNPLGYVSNRYEIVQPQDVLGWFERYISVDDRFQMDVAGSLLGGRIVWATALYRGDIKVAGDDHVARLLMTTTYDGSSATINQATMTRTVCNNTLNVALMDKRAVVRTRHNTVFNPQQVATELAKIVESIDVYKAMGEAMSRVEVSKAEVDAFFAKLMMVKEGDKVSTRKTNQLNALEDAYKTSIAEGAEGKWAVFNAVTRFVDHDRGANANKRDLSSQFGSGSELKRQAFKLLQAA